jgi:hypothetical protein
MRLYREMKLPQATEYLERIVKALERGLQAPDTPWAYRSITEDAYTRLGFISSLLDRQDDAWSALKRVRVLQEQQQAGNAVDQTLVTYNMAYVRARKGEFAAAGQGARKAAELAHRVDAKVLYLLLYLPTLPTWSEPNQIWNTAEVPKAHIAPTMEMQARCFEALAGQYNLDEFEHAADDVGELGSAAFRVLGWTFLTRFNAKEKALIAFQNAQAATQEGEAALIEREISFCSEA